MTQMKKISLFLLSGMSALLLGVLPSCQGDEITEPSVYTPKQLKRLLLENDTKTWQQSTEYYLEDTCRTGYLLRFEDNVPRLLDSAFFVYFLPDPAKCEVILNPQMAHLVKIKKSPIYKTTDSLVFVNPKGDTTIKTVHLLTDQRLILNVAGKDGKIVATEEYRAVN